MTMEPLEPIVRTSLKDFAIARIRSLITDSTLQAGDRFLNEKELVQLLGISRTVVREALKSLETVGLLEIKPGDGIYVSEASITRIVDHVSFGWSHDPKRMRELLETRILLEKSAIELVILRFHETTVETLTAINRQMAEAIANKQSIIELDIGFHRALFQLTGNETFQELSEVVTAFFQEVRGKHFETEPLYITLSEHEEITTAIARKDTDAAKAWMVHHLNPLERSLIRHLESGTKP